MRAKGLGIMKITISGKNIDVTEGLKAAVNEKLGKLEKYFTPDTNVIVTLSVEKERQKIEVTIPVKGNIIRSEQVSNDMYVSIDLVEEVIERQLRKYKEKIVAKHQDGGNFRREFIEKINAEPDEVIKNTLLSKFTNEMITDLASRINANNEAKEELNNLKGFGSQPDSLLFSKNAEEYINGLNNIREVVFGSQSDQNRIITPAEKELSIPSSVTSGNKMILSAVGN